MRWIVAALAGIACAISTQAVADECDAALIQDVEVTRENATLAYAIATFVSASNDSNLRKSWDAKFASSDYRALLGASNSADVSSRLMQSTSYQLSAASSRDVLTRRLSANSAAAYMSCIQAKYPKPLEIISDPSDARGRAITVRYLTIGGTPSQVIVWAKAQGSQGNAQEAPLDSTDNTTFVFDRALGADLIVDVKLYARKSNGQKGALLRSTTYLSAFVPNIRIEWQNETVQKFPAGGPGVVKNLCSGAPCAGYEQYEFTPDPGFVFRPETASIPIARSTVTQTCPDEANTWARFKVGQQGEVQVSLSKIAVEIRATPRTAGCGAEMHYQFQWSQAKADYRLYDGNTPLPRQTFLSKHVPSKAAVQ